ncbi:MAG: hypothetical protein V1659_05305 [Candidatus Woesearchaeota archaeon]
MIKRKLKIRINKPCARVYKRVLDLSSGVDEKAVEILAINPEIFRKAFYWILLQPEHGIEKH